VKIGVVFLMGETDHVEIPNQHPGNVRVEVEGVEFVKEGCSIRMRGWAVDVSDVQSAI
jgi:hypothetical protein